MLRIHYSSTSMARGLQLFSKSAVMKHQFSFFLDGPLSTSVGGMFKTQDYNSIHKRFELSTGPHHHGVEQKPLATAKRYDTRQILEMVNSVKSVFLFSY